MDKNLMTINRKDAHTVYRMTADEAKIIQKFLDIKVDEYYRIGEALQELAEIDIRFNEKIVFQDF